MNRGHQRIKLSLLWILTGVFFVLLFWTFVIGRIISPASKTDEDLGNHFKTFELNRQEVAPSRYNLINQAFPNITEYKTTQRNEGVTESVTPGIHLEKKLGGELNLQPCIGYPRNYITTGIKGRLGNQMFEFASLFGIARKNGLCPVLPARFPLRKLFNISIDTVEQHSNIMFTKNYNEANGGCTFDPNVLSLGNSKSVKLEGYFQSWRYFIDVSQELRKMMRFTPRIRDKARAEFQMLTSSYRKKFDGDISYVAVHVRRGDVTNTKEYTDYGYLPAPIQYIHEGMQKFRSIAKNCLFVVGSDDIDWCKNNIVASDAVFLSSKHTGELDMAILSNCNHTLMTVGSFGWWTAWLVNGKTIYYKGNPRPGSKLEKEFNSSDYRPHSWVGIL